ncbi:hypothetical protein ACWEQL_20140 [Kitasatospora sp. NPDC004240]
MTTTPPVPPPPNYPPSVGFPLHTPTPLDPVEATTTTTLDDAAERFWAPVQKIAQDWWQATGPDGHLTDELVLPPVTGWEQPNSKPDGVHRVADRIALILSETEPERAHRLQAERDAAYALAGETKRHRTERHKREDRARETKVRRRQVSRELFNSALRAKRFNRWLLLTGISALLGWRLGAVQVLGAVIRSSSDPVMGVGAGLFLSGLGYAVDWYLRGGTRDGGATPVTEIRGKVRVPLLIVTRIPVSSALAALLSYTPGSLFPPLT